MVIHLIAAFIKKILHNISQYFPKPYYKPFGEHNNVKVDLSNYILKTYLKNETGIATSNLALKSTLAKLKAELDKTYVDKLNTVTVDLSKQSDEVNNEVVTKNVYDQLAGKVNSIDTSGFVLKS